MEQDNIEAMDTGATQEMDVPVSGDTRTEDQMLADIMRKSDFTKDLYPEAEEIPAPEGTLDDDDQVPEVDDEVVEDPEIPEVQDEDDTSTQDSVYTLEDLDDFSVMVKIDGEEQAVNIKDLVKGYSTEQHLSQKGRELGDARKQLETDREVKIKEIDNVLSAASTILMNSEKKLADEYHSIDAEIKQAREDGDTYALSELKDKKEVAQEKYWAARNEREGMIKQATEQKQQIENEKWNKQMEDFGNKVTDVIPDWSEEVATDIRKFVLERGIPESYIPQLADVNIVKFIDDYRRSEMARSKGAVKRQKAPAKATPVRQQPPQATKKAQAAQVNKDKVLSGEGSKADQDAFLRNLVSKHFD